MSTTDDNVFSATLSAADWGALAAYAAAMIGIGWWYARKNRNAEDYLVGGRKMNPVAVGISYFVAIFSTITYLALPGEMIRNGPMIFGGLIGLPIVYVVAGYFIIPVFMTLKVSSGYELLEQRLGNSARLLGVALFLLLRFLWMAVILFAATDKVLVPLTNASPNGVYGLLIGMAALAIIYASMGGLKAIVAVDVMQFCLLFGGVLISMAVIAYQLGGVDWWPAAWPAHWQAPSLLPSAGSDRSLLAAVMAMVVWNICTAGSDQMAIQRYLATRDIRAARQMLGVSLVVTCAIQFVLGCLGLALLAYASSGEADSALAADVAGKADQIFPRFIVSTLPTGIAGLMIAGLLAEAMNSLASGINAAAAVISNDLLPASQQASDGAQHELRRVRTISIASGIVVFLLSTLVSAVSGNLLEITYKLVNLLTAPLFSLFFMAIFVRRATGRGAVIGAIVGVGVAVTINFWREIITIANYAFDTAFDANPPVSFLWAPPISLLLAISIGCLVSMASLRTSQK